MIDAYNAQLASYIRIILKNRKSYVNKLGNMGGKRTALFPAVMEEISIVYKETVPETGIAETLKKLRERELFRGQLHRRPAQG